LDNPTGFLTDLADQTPVGATARAAHATFTALTAGFPDVPRQLRLAAELIRSGSPSPRGAADVGALIVYLPPRLAAAELQLLAALAPHLTIRLALAGYDDAVADAPMDAPCAMLAAVLGTPPLSVDAEGLRRGSLVSSAPDPDE